MAESAAGLEQRELRALTGELCVPEGEEPFGAYLFGPDEPGAELGRHLERQVFLEAFGNTVEDLAREYARYEKSSLFIVIVDHVRRLPAGVIRVVTPSPAGLKSLNDLEAGWGESADIMMQRTGLDFEPDKIWDVATLAVPPEYRGRATQGLVTMGLYQTLTMGARSIGVELLVAILDVPGVPDAPLEAAHDLRGLPRGGRAALSGVDGEHARVVRPPLLRPAPGRGRSPTCTGSSTRALGSNRHCVWRISALLPGRPESGIWP